MADPVVQPSQGLAQIPLSFNIQDADASCLRLLQKLGTRWENLQSESLKYTRFTDGITNTLIKASCQFAGQREAEEVLIRAYGSGTDAIIDRAKELRAHHLLATKGLAPELLATFENGFIYYFVPGDPCTPQDFHDADVSRLMAQKLAEWHSSLPTDVLTGKQPPKSEAGRPEPNIWSNARLWISFLPANTPDLQARNAMFNRELDWLEGLFVDLPGPLAQTEYVWSHTDLLCGNVIISPDRKHVTFIDHEYATTAAPAFDVANVFAEHAGPDQVYEWMPSRSQRLAFIETYVDTFRSLRANTNPPTNRDEDVARLYQQVDDIRGLIGFYWGIWGLCQASISDIDFDFTLYAQRRHSEYWGWKSEYMGEGKEKTVREIAWAKE